MPFLGEVRDFDGWSYIWVELYPPVRQWVELEEWNNRGWVREVFERAIVTATDVQQLALSE